MSDFNEFDQQGSVPAKETGSIISHAFEMYKGTFLYAIVAMILYVAVSYIAQFISGFNSMAMIESMKTSQETGAFNYWATPGLGLYYGLSFLLGLLLSPLYVGIIYIYNKYNNKEQIQFNDLFIGYKQNMMNIIIYNIFTSLILGIAMMFCFVPFFFVLPLVLIGYPILLFENATAMEALNKSFTIAKENYGTFLGASFLGLLISIAGIVLCGIGIIATALFITAVMYSTYIAFQGKPRALLNK